MGKLIDETKKKYGRLRVICRVEHASRQAMWKCKCKCGNEVIVVGQSLREGLTQSCGCWHKELLGKRSTKHGGTGTPEHDIWNGIKKRCYNPNVEYYDRYGGRGVRMCKRWRESFKNFLADVGPRPSPKHSLDRFPDNNGDYEPGNVRWATQSEQMLNTRRTKYVTIAGKKRPAVSVAREHGIGYKTFRGRVDGGWSVIRACTQPTKKKEKL